MPTPLHRQLRLLRRAGSFRLLFLATLGSGIGTWMATIALTVDIEARTNSSWWVSALFIVTFLPSIVVGLAAGPLIDRFSRKRLVISADLVRLGVFAALPFVGSALGMIALAAVAGVANSFFRPAVLAGVPNLVSDGDLGHGTALLQATDWAAATLGPILGGVITGASSPHVVYWINAATFAYSALLLLQIPARLLQSEQAISRGHWRDLTEGLTVFRRSPALVTVVVAFGFTMLASGLINVSEVFLAKHVLHRGAFGFGLLWSASGLGLVVGSLFSGSLLEDREVTAIYPLVFLPWAAGILGAGVAPNIWVAACAMVLAGFGNGLAFPMTVLIIQRYTVDRLRGRAFTLVISAHNALLGIGQVAAGAFLTFTDARWTYAMASGLLVTASVAAVLLIRGLVTTTIVARQQAA